MSKITKEFIDSKLAEVKAANPGVKLHYIIVASDDGDDENLNDQELIIFRKFNRIEYQEARVAEDEGGIRKINAEDRLARGVSLYPPKAEMNALLELNQALALRLYNVCMTASAGGRLQELKKG